MVERASSIVVKKNKSRMAVGKWIQVGAGRQEFEFSFGFSYEKSNVDAAAAKSTLTNQMTVGIEFAHNIGVTQTMTHEHTQMTASAAHDVMDTEVSGQVKFACPHPADPLDNAVGYWVFAVTSADGSVVAKNKGGVCRYGEGLWNVGPDCPFSAC
jgi:hypothetical protein